MGVLLNWIVKYGKKEVEVFLEKNARRKSKYW